MGFASSFSLLSVTRILGLSVKEESYQCELESGRLRDTAAICEVVGCLLFASGGAIVADGPGGGAVGV